MNPPRLVLLDRDGTINRHLVGDYVRMPEQLELLPGAGAAIARLNAAGIRVVVVTNQRGVARGLMTLDDLTAVGARLDDLLAAEGARIDATFACPHEAGTCECRKPLPGLVRSAMTDAGVTDPADCVLIGDQPTDVLAASAADVPAVLLGRDAVDLMGAVEALLGRSAERPAAADEESP